MKFCVVLFEAVGFFRLREINFNFVRDSQKFELKVFERTGLIGIVNYYRKNKGKQVLFEIAGTSR